MIEVYQGNLRICYVDRPRAVAMSRASNVTVRRKRGEIHAIHIHEREPGKTLRARRPLSTTVAEDSQAVYRQHIGGQSQRPTLLFQHRTHDAEHELAYLMLLGSSRRALMGTV